MFDRLVHADWSIAQDKRWMAVAEQRGDTWCIEHPPVNVGPSDAFLAHEFALAAEKRIALGFDFPIGLPVAYGKLTGFDHFLHALRAFGSAPSCPFFSVGEEHDDISIQKPFYPNRSRPGVKREHLTSRLGIPWPDLLRECDRRTSETRDACVLFWTLGGNQVGKAAIAGWREVVLPAMRRGARLWPFEGSLGELAAGPGIVLAETYPAIAYGIVQAPFLAGESKRRQADRQRKASHILGWTMRQGIQLSEDARSALSDGFGPSSTGEDRFDAFVGLLKMIAVARGVTPEGAGKYRDWEGWILGRPRPPEGAEAA